MIYSSTLFASSPERTILKNSNKISQICRYNRNNSHLGVGLSIYVLRNVTFLVPSVTVTIFM